MSTKSKLVLTSSVIVTCSIIVGVHISQELEKRRIRAGVLRDIERLKSKESTSTTKSPVSSPPSPSLTSIDTFSSKSDSGRVSK